MPRHVAAITVPSTRADFTDLDVLQARMDSISAAVAATTSALTQWSCDQDRDRVPESSFSESNSKSSVCYC